MPLPSLCRYQVIVCHRHGKHVLAATDSDGPHQQNNSWFRVLSEPIIIIFFSSPLRVLKWDLLFNVGRVLTATGHSPFTGVDSSGTHSLTASKNYSIVSWFQCCCRQSYINRTSWMILEPSCSKIWWWVPWDPKPKFTVLARASRNLGVSQSAVDKLIVASE
jgi:hypothetical protein